MAYFPDYPPVAADVDSYEFKEWLNSIQRFYLSEVNFLDVTDYEGPTVSELPLKLEYTYIYRPNNGSAASDFPKLILPNYTKALGKMYFLVAGGAALLTFRHLTGDKAVTEASPYGSDTDAVTGTKRVLLCTREGWAYIE